LLTIDLRSQIRRRHFFSMLHKAWRLGLSRTLQQTALYARSCIKRITDFGVFLPQLLAFK
jgi:hypothetical protein